MLLFLNILSTILHFIKLQYLLIIRERKSNMKVLNMIEEPRQIIRIMEIRKNSFLDSL
jgi:hypothetical protein